MEIRRSDMRTIAIMMLIVSLCLIGTGMHDIDNAWNMAHFRDYRNIVDCNTFTCLSDGELYQFGVNCVFIGVLLILGSISIFLVYANRNYEKD